MFPFPFPPLGLVVSVMMCGSTCWRTHSISVKSGTRPLATFMLAELHLSFSVFFFARAIRLYFACNTRTHTHKHADATTHTDTREAVRFHHRQRRRRCQNLGPPSQSLTHPQIHKPVASTHEKRNTTTSPPATGQVPTQP